MTIFNSHCFPLSSLGSCFSSHHICLSSSKRLCPQHMPHLLHLQFFSHPPHFSLPHRPLSCSLCWAPSSAVSPSARPQLQLSSPSPATAAPQRWGHGHLQLTAKQRSALCTTFLLPHATLLLSLLPQASPPSTELRGIKMLQSNQNSHGHQIGTEREQIWLQRKIQHSYANARMAIGFHRLAKFAVSVPL